MHSHHDGEVWGLVILEENGKFITGCDDNKILMYDIATRRCVQRGFLVEPLPGQTERLESAKAKTKSAKMGGASTSSKEPPER